MLKQTIIVLLLLITTMGASGNRPIHIFMGGDSTMADKVLSKTATDSVAGITVEELFLERGWGQLLPEFVSNDAVIINHAKNGRSTRTFVEEGWWSKIIDHVQMNDVVILQFGHNDSSEKNPERYTNPIQFRLNFIAFVSEIRSRGAIPVLCTPVARRWFNSAGELRWAHGVYPDVIRDVAREMNAPLIDMEIMTANWLISEGDAPSRRFFHQFPPGVSKLYPAGLDDNTHFNEAGARIVATLFVEEAMRQKLQPLTEIFKK